MKTCIDVRWNYFCDCSSSFSCSQIFLNYSSSSCACVRDSVQVAPGGAENTHWNVHKRHLCLKGNYRQFFWIVAFKREWCSNRANGAPRCGEAYGDSPVSLATTHMLWLHGKSGQESTEWSPMSGCEPGPWTCVQTWTWAKVKARPRPLVNASRRADKSRSDKKTLSKVT